MLTTTVVAVVGSAVTSSRAGPSTEGSSATRSNSTASSSGCENIDDCGQPDRPVAEATEPDQRLPFGVLELVDLGGLHDRRSTASATPHDWRMRATSWS